MGLQTTNATALGIFLTRISRGWTDSQILATYSAVIGSEIYFSLLLQNSLVCHYGQMVTVSAYGMSDLSLH